MAYVKTQSVIDAIMTVASAATVIGAAKDVSTCRPGSDILLFYSPYDATAHTAATFPHVRIWQSPDTTGDVWFRYLDVGFGTTTAVANSIDDASCEAGDTTVTIHTAATGYVRDGIFFIKDATLGNSEWCEIASVSSLVLTLARPLIRSHANDTVTCNQAETRKIPCPIGANRILLGYYGATGPASCFASQLLAVTE